MIYLSGGIDEGLPSGAGYMLQPGMGNKPADLDARHWAADNGCFTQKGTFNYERWLTWLAAQPSRQSCLFATAPDVVGDALATLAMAPKALAMIRSLGYRAALVAQDGLQDLDIPWDTFDCLFIGGSTEWKISHHAMTICREAKARGKWLHMGRVNSLRRLRIAELFGCDSADGTFLAIRRRQRGGGKPRDERGVPEIAKWLHTLETSPCLPLAFAS